MWITTAPTQGKMLSGGGLKLKLIWCVELRKSGPSYENLTLDAFASSDDFHSAASNYQARQLAHRIDVSGAWIT